MRRSVDFGHGVLDIQKSKGYDQHYVALHQSTAELLGRYDRAADRLCPDRTYFFESPEGQPYSRAWVSYNFSLLWEKRTEKREILSPMISGIITLLQTSTAGKMTHLNLMTASIIWQDQWDTDAQSLRCIIIQLSQGLQT